MKKNDMTGFVDPIKGKKNGNALKDGWIDLAAFREKYNIEKAWSINLTKRMNPEHIHKFLRMTLVYEPALCHLANKSYTP